MLITKSDGTTEEFNPAKLVSSLMRSGAQPQAAEDIRRQVEQELRPGITTGEIYRHASEHLREHKNIAAAKYSLKRAILDFGPSGFPFESYLSKLFEFEGYTTEVDQIIHGACVEHEVDVILTKGKELVFVEAKFHNNAGFKTDLKTVLYVHSRMEDVNAARGEHKEGAARGMVATNTKFTTHALRYSSCAGLDLLGWEYPNGNTLHEKIDKSGLYPITALTTLNRREKAAILAERIVLCGALLKDQEVLARAGVPPHRVSQVLAEAGGLSQGRAGI